MASGSSEAPPPKADDEDDETSASADPPKAKGKAKGKAKAAADDDEKKGDGDETKEENPEGEKFDKEEVLAQKPGKHGCTDLICLIIFGLGLTILVSLDIKAFAEGDSRVVLHGKDHDGEVCGVSEGVEDFPLIYYPSIERPPEEPPGAMTQDMYEAMVASSLKSQKGVCTKECPQAFNRDGRGKNGTICPSKDHKYCTWYGRSSKLVLGRYCVIQIKEETVDEKGSACAVANATDIAMAELEDSTNKEMDLLSQGVSSNGNAGVIVSASTEASTEKNISNNLDNITNDLTTTSTTMVIIHISDSSLMGEGDRHVKRPWRQESLSVSGDGHLQRKGQRHLHNHWQRPTASLLEGPATDAIRESGLVGSSGLDDVVPRKGKIKLDKVLRHLDTAAHVLRTTTHVLSRPSRKAHASEEKLSPFVADQDDTQFPTKPNSEAMQNPQGVSRESATKGILREERARRTSRRSAGDATTGDPHSDDDVIILKAEANNLGKKGGPSSNAEATDEEMVKATKGNLIQEQKAADAEMKDVILEGIETDSKPCKEKEREGRWSQMVADIMVCRVLILVASPCFSLVIGFIFMGFIRMCAVVLMWLTLIALQIALTIVTFYLHTLCAQLAEDGEERYAQLCEIGYWVSGILAVVVLVVMISCRKAITMTGKVFEIATTCLMQVPSLLLLPPISVVLAVIWATYMIYAMIHVFAAGLLIEPAETAYGEYNRYSISDATQNLLLFHVFAFLFGQQFIGGLCILALAIGASRWYFAELSGGTEGERIVPKLQGLRSLLTAFMWHMGTIAIGAFLVAIVQFIRFLFGLMEKQMNELKHSPMWCIVRVADCILWCLESMLKFLNRKAFLMCGITGKGFCASAKEVMQMAMRNPHRFTLVEGMGWIIEAVASLLCTCGTVFFCYLILKHTDSYKEEVKEILWPLMAIAVVAHIVGKIVASCIGATSDTIFFCFLVDEEMNDGVPAHAPGGLKDFCNQEELKKNKKDKGAPKAENVKGRGCCGC